jgi:hypothetical protein
MDTNANEKVVTNVTKPNPLKAKTPTKDDLKKGEELKKTATAKKPTTPKTPKVKVITFVSKLDEIIKQGGSWEKIVEKGNAAKAELEKANKVKIDFSGKPKIMSLIKYRMEVQKKADYLGKKKVTEKGIV